MRLASAPGEIAERLPDRVSGERMRKHLDFVVIGANKAGTTSLFEYLRRHPGVAVPSDKEAPYFSRDSVVARGWMVSDATFCLS